MRRRPLLPLALASLASAAAAQSLPTDPGLAEAVRAFAALGDDTACLIEATSPRGQMRAAHREDAPLFVGSCIKTFILAAWLQEVEAGRLSLDERLAVDDGARAPVSPVLSDLNGTASARMVLEAMIAHSDNTATDIAIRRVGAARVREVIAKAGLAQTRIPDSTRVMIATLLGEPPGRDMAWPAISAALDNMSGRTLRPMVNPHQTMVSTSRDLVAWYEAALRGRYFTTAASLAEFKRIQAMATAMPQLAPADVIAYGKGGSITWNGQQALAVGGQMVAGPVRATFCFAINWNGDEATMAPMTQRVVAAARAAMARVPAALG